MNHGEESEKKSHPWQRANLLSKVTFLYTRGLFWRTYHTNKLEEDDLYDVPHNFKSQKLGDELENILNLELDTHEVPSIYRLLWRCYGKEYLLIGLVQLLMRTVIVTVIPTSLSKIVKYFDPLQKEITKEEACLYAVLLITTNIINIIYLHNYMLTVATLGMRVKTAFCALMYRMSLKLTTASLADIPIGKIVTFMTKDVTAFEKMILYGNDIWIGFVQAGVVCYLIYGKMGIAAFAGVGFLLLIIPFQIYIATKASKLRLKAGQKTDERLQITQETISAIKLIKMYTWEKFFKQKILCSRRREVNTIVKIFLTKIGILLIGALTSKIAFYFLVMTYVWLGHSVSAELVYFVLSLFQRLRHVLNVVVPIGITESAELHASVKRMGSLLRADTLEVTGVESVIVTPRISLKEVTVSVNDEKIITNITLTLESGLTILTGPIGSGKSVLLKTILGDHKIVEGTVKVDGRISYASQEPWIFPSTIKQNIVFGEKFNRSRYEKVLKVCALDFDLSFFEEGDNLIIGDKGINLSKGQKARINLARAVYKDSEIYILDDCLTALDAHVKDHVFSECIRGFLREKLCILSTNNTEYLQSGDNLMVMENGSIKAFKKATNKDVNDIKIISNIDRIDKEVYDDDEIIEDSSNNNENDDEKSKLLGALPETGVQNIYREEKRSGKVGVDIYRKYISYGGGFFILVVIIAFFVTTQISKSYTEKLVSGWVDLEENLTNFQTNNLTGTTEYKNLVADHTFILIVFSLLTLITTILYMVTSFLFFNFTRKASNRLHKAMVEYVINAVMQFFDGTFIGNILNRFSNDLAIIDEYFPFDVFEFFEIFLELCGIIIILAIVNVAFLVPATVVLSVLFVIRKFYMPTGRNLQRLESATRSPIVGYLNASLEGLTTVRAFHAQKLLTKEFDKHQDRYTSASFTNKCCTRAFGLALDTSCTIFIAVITGYFLAFDKSTSVGNVGLAITQAFMLSGLVQYGIRRLADLENKMTSVERVLEYTNKEQEAKHEGSKPIGWPSKGKIQFQNVTLLYPSSDSKILKNVTFTIEGEEKIGIVGRTGAGKTSIISVLFRLYNYKGKIVIDGIDTSSINLEYLRSNIAIIPQDPVLFTGTIRSNIDPLGSHEDAHIWSALEKVKLSQIVSSLDMKISESGLNFSTGQKQLLCLARAVISRNKIIVLDEATATMDEESDALIHNVLEANFKFCTVVTIAHKLKHVLKCDKVMLVNKGEVIEYDDPNSLLRNKNGQFYKMIDKAGLL